MSENADERWAQFYSRKTGQGAVATWPNESLVRFFKGQYFPWFKKSYAGMKIIDVGFGSANNLMFFGTLGMQLHGVEVHADICELFMERLARTGYSADLKAGTNREIPFPDEQFDYLVSWDAIHYEGDSQRIEEALAEFARVLKPGGRLFMSTVAPKHTIFRDTKIVGHHRYLLGREDDFRKGEVFFCFDAPQYIHYFLAPHFTDIQTGRSTLDYFFEINDTFLITATKATAADPDR